MERQTADADSLNGFANVPTLVNLASMKASYTSKAKRELRFKGRQADYE